jgi:CRP/FNR family transcriptional regulator
MTALLDILAAVGRVYPFLAGLPAPLASRLCDEAVAKRLPAGQRVFGERDACQFFPLVLSGRIRVAKGDARGRRLKLYDVGPGDSCILTSVCLLSQRAYPAEGTTETEVELLLLPGALFGALVDGFEPMRRHVFALFADRLADLMVLVESVAFQRLDQRLAARLLGHGTLLRATHQQLADDLGSAREIVSRVLGQFVDEGLIRSGRQEIEILDPAGLRRRAATETT